MRWVCKDKTIKRFDFIMSMREHNVYRCLECGESVYPKKGYNPSSHTCDGGIKIKKYGKSKIS